LHLGGCEAEMLFAQASDFLARCERGNAKRGDLTAEQNHVQLRRERLKERIEELDDRWRVIDQMKIVYHERREVRCSLVQCLRQR